MEKGVNWIENQGENLYKILKNSFDEKLDQLWVQVSQELNVIETNNFFSAERGGQSDRDEA